MNIYITDLSTICNPDDLAKKLSLSDLARFRSFKQKKRAIQFLVAHAIKSELENRFQYISIAHKDHLVIVAASSAPIGVDIEDASKQRDFNSLGKFIGLKNIKTSDEFYRAFTLAEAKYKSNADASARFYKLQKYMICIISNDQDITWENSALVPEQI